LWTFIVAAGSSMPISVIWDDGHDWVLDVTGNPGAVRVPSSAHHNPLRSAHPEICGHAHHGLAASPELAVRRHMDHSPDRSNMLAIFMPSPEPWIRLKELLQWIAKFFKR
jgi:hypothetical protein